MQIAVVIFAVTTILGIMGWVAWHSLEEVIRLGLMEIDLEEDEL